MLTVSAFTFTLCLVVYFVSVLCFCVAGDTRRHSWAIGMIREMTVYKRPAASGTRTVCPSTHTKSREYNVRECTECTERARASEAAWAQRATLKFYFFFCNTFFIHFIKLRIFPILIVRNMILIKLKSYKLGTYLGRKGVSSKTYLFERNFRFHAHLLGILSDLRCIKCRGSSALRAATSFSVLRKKMKMNRIKLDV